MIIRVILSNRYIRFVIINIIIFFVTAPLIVLFGPFKNIKSGVVGAIMTSRHPHYISWLFTDKEMKEILGDYANTAQIRQDLFNFAKRQDKSLRLVNINSNRFHGFLLEVPDPSRIKVATARDLQEKGDTVSTIAINNNAIAAINAGGFYDPEGTGVGRLPYGIIVQEGRFLIGGDIVERVDVVGFTNKGVLIAGKYSPSEMHKLGLAEGVTFGPPLIINGKKLIKEGDGGWGVAPRTAIGQRKDGTVLLLVVDGRQPGYSIGATLLDVQNILYEQGAFVAANLDGGSSTTMFYDGKVVNKPCDMLGERMIPTAFIVK